MNILMIWGESLDKPGSGTAHCRGLYHGWRADGHRVTLLCPQYGDAPRWEGGLEARAIKLPPKSLLSFFLLQVWVVLALPMWLRRYRPDCVYVRTCFMQGIQALICRAFGVPLVGEVDSIVDEEIRMRGHLRWAAPLTRMLDCFNNRLSHGLVCVTPGIRQETLRRGGRPARTVAIPNGAPMNFQPPASPKPARQRLGLSTEGTVISFAGNFAPWQGLDLLLDAVGEIDSAVRQDLQIVLMGDGQSRSAVLERIDSEGLANTVRWLPSGGPEEVREVLAASDAAVIPIHDPRKLRYGISPLKFWEALAMGIGVLVPEGSQLEDVLDALDLPGCFDPESAASLGEAITKVVGRTNDLRARRPEIATRVAEQHSWLQVSRCIIDFVRSLPRD
jgi:glycosyltransferase involved in cell wall biosynthesis